MTREFAAPPGQVFAAWVDPVIAAKWLFRTPEGTVIRAEIDPQEGGEFVFVERREDEDIVHVGEYLAFDAPRRLVFAFSLDQFRTTNEVAVDFEPAGAGTRVTITHKLDVRWVEFAARAEAGWNMMLDGLQQALSYS